MMQSLSVKLARYLFVEVDDQYTLTRKQNDKRKSSCDNRTSHQMIVAKGIYPSVVYLHYQMWPFCNSGRVPGLVRAFSERFNMLSL